MNSGGEWNKHRILISPGMLNSSETLRSLAYVATRKGSYSGQSNSVYSGAMTVNIVNMSMAKLMELIEIMYSLRS